MSIEDTILELPKKGVLPLLDKVALLSEIGRGNMGVVYAGWHESLDIPVAVKFMRKPREREMEILARFRREARLCAELDEPNIVRVLDLGAFRDLNYIVMEWVAGVGLDAVVCKTGPMAEQEVLTVLRDVGQAMMALHRRDVVHRDIKPSNIMLRARDGRVKLGDLGLATDPREEDLKLTHDLLGTPAYMSPEQIGGKKLDGASDIFSLGLTAFTLLTGDLPFTGSSIFAVWEKLRHEPLPDLQALNPEVSDATRDLLVRMTGKDRGERIGKAENLLDELPLVSMPFRRETLDAARPDYEVQKPGPAQESASPGVENGLEESELLTTTPLVQVSDSIEPEAFQDVAAAPSLLICQCLQKDFITPLARNQKPPNKLHVGWREATRIVGPDPASGPLVHAVSACAYSDNVRTVYIRDWHDSDDPLQRPELDHFGDHCLIGSEGARFIDAIEAYSRDRFRTAVVDAIGINDFEDTPMTDILDALTEDEPRDTLPVGVIGVWTNVKIHYLLYDLKTRGQFLNLATCSKLVGAPDPVAHKQALDHMERVLGVKVFHDVQEFLAFLNVSSEPEPARGA